MLLRIKLYDAGLGERGHVRIELNWPKNRWTLTDDPHRLWPRVGFTSEGPFEATQQGVLFVWDSPKQHNTLIIRDAPASETVFKRDSGAGQIFDATDPLFRHGCLDWYIEKVSITLHEPPPLSAMRKAAMKKLTELLPAPYGGDKWKANPFKAIKPGPVVNYTNCVDFPAHYIIQLTGKKLIAPGYPPPSTPGWRYADPADETQLPLPGDIFILCKSGRRDGTTAHVGIVYSTAWDNSGGLKWRTGDWGQGNDSFNGDFVVRTFDKSNKALTNGPWDSRPARAILGWVDLEGLAANAKPLK